MSILAAEPHQLLVRLERKYEKKIQAIEARRRIRNLRNNLSRIDGTTVDNVRQDTNMEHYLDLTV